MVRLEALAQALHRASMVGPTQLPGPPATTGAGQAGSSALEDASIRWLADPVSGDEVRLDHDGGSSQPRRQALEALGSSARPLPSEAAAVLGMPAGTTIGHAVTELRLAVDDPSGPRCRSYRAAASYLRGLDRIAQATAELERVAR